MNIDISVVIPTRHRIEELKACLNALIDQVYHKNRFEIIVVDDGDSIVTKNLVESFRKTYPNLKYLAQYSKGPASARNLGIEISSGKIIGFIDDDCIVGKDWIRLMMNNYYDNPSVAAVGGFTSVSTSKMSGLVSQFLSTASIEVDINKRKEIIFFPTCNVSVRRVFFDKYKFNENFYLPGGEDLELFWRLFKDGHRFIWNKNIKVIHWRKNTIKSFIRQAYVYGKGNILVQHIHNDHPLLKELKTNKFSFWIATLINIIKIPCFSFLLGRRFIKESNIRDRAKKLSAYLYFMLHKIFYIIGNIMEIFRIDSNRGKYSMRIPQLLILDVTHSCNLACRICNIWKAKANDKDIDIADIKRVISEANRLGIEEIVLSGGEPLLRKDIFDVFGHARGLNIKNLGVLTNGITVGQYIEKLKPYLINNTLSLVFSFDSLRADIHNYIRNAGTAWQKTRESLEILSVLKDKYPQINFNVISIILNQNLEELLELAVFVLFLKANSLQFQPLLSNNLKMAERRESTFWIGEDRLPVLDRIIDKLIDFKEDNPAFIKNSISNLSLIKKYYRGTLTSRDVTCFSAENTILISTRGECTTCFSCYGNIKKQTLKDVFTSKNIIKAQDKVKKCSWPCLLPCFCD